MMIAHTRAIIQQRYITKSTHSICRMLDVRGSVCHNRRYRQGCERAEALDENDKDRPLQTKSLRICFSPTWIHQVGRSACVEWKKDDVYLATHLPFDGRLNRFSSSFRRIDSSNNPGGSSHFSLVLVTALHFRAFVVDKLCGVST